MRQETKEFVRQLTRASLNQRNPKDYRDVCRGLASKLKELLRGGDKILETKLLKAFERIK